MTLKRGFWVVGLSLLTMWIGNHIQAVRDDTTAQLAKVG